MTFLQSNNDRLDAQDVVEHPYMCLYESVLLPSGPFPEVHLSQAPTTSSSSSSSSSSQSYIGQLPLSRPCTIGQPCIGRPCTIGQPPIVKLEPTAAATPAMSHAISTTRTNTRDHNRNDHTQRRADGTNAKASATQWAAAAPASTASDATDKDEEQFEDVLTLLHRDDFNLDGLDDDEENTTMTPPCATATTATATATATKKPAATKAAAVAELETATATKKPITETETETATATKKPITETETIGIDDDDVMEPFFTNQDGTDWLDQFNELLIYKSKHMGSTTVPLHYRRNRSLGPWIRRQRLLLNYNKLPPKFRFLLIQVADFECTEWKRIVARNELVFRTMYKRIVEHKKNHGTVEHLSKDLIQWMCKVRNLRNHRDWMDPIHKKLLNNIGFQWEPGKERYHKIWMKMYDALKQYKKMHFGSVMVPCRYMHESTTQGRRKRVGLGYWVSVQRKRHAQNLLQRYRVELLEQVGFVWDATVRPGSDLRDWEAMYHRLEQFKSSRQTIKEPTSSDRDHLELFYWCQRQRKSNSLHVSQRALLDKICFHWNA